MQQTLIENGILVNEGQSVKGYVVVCGDRIAEIGQGSWADKAGGRPFEGRRIDASGCLVIPGVIDDQVHFRDPGLTYKGDMASESRAAVAGGVTSFMDMPNTLPPTISRDALERKIERAADCSYANYSFYLGATNENIEQIRRADPRTVCGVKVFMGSSTGNMLVDEPKALSAIFAESPLLVAVHCESEPMIRAAAEQYRERYGERITPSMHPLIRSAEACYRSSASAVELADRYGTDLHVLHLSTARELSLFDSAPVESKKITNEVCVHHLWFNDEDYRLKGNLIKWNPAIKTDADRQALRRGLTEGRVDVVATDHAPHTLQEKGREYWDCPSGGPLVQHSLAAMLTIAKGGAFGVETVVEKMCHAPARRFRVEGRGFLKSGYFADIAIVAAEQGPVVAKDNILYKCGWSPFEGTAFAYRVKHTMINGQMVFSEGEFDETSRGQMLLFNR